MSRIKSPQLTPVLELPPSQGALYGFLSLGLLAFAVVIQDGAFLPYFPRSRCCRYNTTLPFGLTAFGSTQGLDFQAACTFHSTHNIE